MTTHPFLRNEGIRWQTVITSLITALMVGATSAYITASQAVATQAEWNRQAESATERRDARLLRLEVYFQSIDQRLSRIEGALNVK